MPIARGWNRLYNIRWLVVRFCSLLFLVCFDRFLLIIVRGFLGVPCLGDCAPTREQAKKSYQKEKSFHPGKCS
jgi:hypothetical protein